MTKKELISLAIKSKEKAIPTYSNFRVGAALLTKENKVITGANIENASYGLTLCAERLAIFTALHNGERNFKAIAIAADSKEYISPCGACRQIMMEFCGPNLDVIMINSEGKHKTIKMKELLPYSFDKEYLKNE
ncbi:MAG: cytidine deaminase [Stygiobacter sp.]|jgi:cytidine deaminase|uniref:Cytidine deaminase n=1 Tax=Stygiobacter electus TaxID=3032292 RepID=A0AAE3P1T4_9BACT|nr:cytidine deaminase [Stygiobacter electus]MDF1612504.1 cytidine deaminase [Stygiobacter electus]